MRCVMHNVRMLMKLVTLQYAGPPLFIKKLIDIITSIDLAEQVH